jgi:hypothetical protein
MVRQLIIVSGNRAHLYEHLDRGFARNGTVRVFSIAASEHDGHAPDSMWPNGARRIAACLRRSMRYCAIGWTILPLDVKDHHRDSAL